MKALYGAPYPIGHNLTNLLDGLADRGDELLSDGDVEDLVEFVRDLNDRDCRGDEGRYWQTKDGQPSLALVCCADPVLLREHVSRFYGYVQRRLFFPALSTTLTEVEGSSA